MKRRTYNFIRGMGSVLGLMPARRPSRVGWTPSLRLLGGPFDGEVVQWGQPLFPPQNVQRMLVCDDHQELHFYERVSIRGILDEDMLAEYRHCPEETEIQP